MEPQCSCKRRHCISLRRYRQWLRHHLSDWMYRLPNDLITRFPELAQHRRLLHLLALRYFEWLATAMELAWVAEERPELHAPPYWRLMPKHPVSAPERN